MDRGKTPSGGPSIRNSELIGAGNKFQAVKDQDGNTKFAESIQQQQGKQRPSIDADIAKRKQDVSQNKQQDKTPQKDLNKDKDSQKEH